MSGRLALMAILLSPLAVLWTGCGGSDDPYNGLERFGEEDITCTSLEFDTLRLDAQYTSLSGQWHIKDSLLCFVDEYAVGVKEYDLDGEFVGEHIRQGKGPDEVIAASFSSSFDKTTGDLIMQDSNCFIHRFSKDYRKLFSLNQAWFTALSQDFGNKGWSDLYNNPDPETPQMYEYNYVCDRIQAIDSEVIMPVITEHVRYNGYDKRFSKGFWADSYIFIRFRPEEIGADRALFGHYPPVYRRKNIPVFAGYDFYAKETGLAVTFNADPRIFLIDYDGGVTGCFGFPEDGISGKYPETTSFEDYESKYKKMRKEYGYYDRLVRAGGHIFRTCRLDNSAGTVLQVYDSDYDLIGRVPVADGFEVIGEYDGVYYAYSGLDLDSEQFILLRFRL